ncbi:MAG: hypothetical protein ACTMIR_04090 [Cellulomonadaceae bacterium]
MSAQTAAAPQAIPAAAPARPRPRIHVVPPPRTARSRVPYVLFCMALVGAALISVLLLNTTMANGAYESRDLQAQIAQLAQSEQALLAQLEEASAPTALAERAQRLGMVQDSTPAFLRLSDGAIIGDPSPSQVDQ